jgi:MOSC domain-containing protein YiiM
MKILSICVGLPQKVRSRGQTVLTSIYKSPVEGRVRVSRLNVAGDQQSDLTVHGGFDKAVYAYPAEHYPGWRQELGMEIPWGMFGENLTTQGLTEETVCIGDRLRAGSVEFVVTQPRMPCFKLAIRFGRQDIGRPFLQSRRTGFYLSVAQEGEIGAGDEIEVVSRDEAGVTVADIVGLYISKSPDPGLLRRASQLSALPEMWGEHFRQQAQDHRES